MDTRSINTAKASAGYRDLVNAKWTTPQMMLYIRMAFQMAEQNGLYYTGD